MTIGAALTWVLGLALVAINPAIAQIGWFMTKFALVIGLLVYHYRCLLWIRRLAASSETQDSKWLRWFNEIPVAFLLGIILLAVAKPF
jgi:putative membrane protein